MWRSGDLASMLKPELEKTSSNTHGQYYATAKGGGSIGGGDVWALDLVTDAGARHGAEQPAAAGRRNGGGRRRRWRRQKRRPGGRCRAANHRRGGHLLLLGIVVRRHRPCRLQLRQRRRRHDDEEHEDEGRDGRAQRRRSHGSPRRIVPFSSCVCLASSLCDLCVVAICREDCREECERRCKVFIGRGGADERACKQFSHSGTQHRLVGLLIAQVKLLRGNQQVTVSVSRPRRNWLPNIPASGHGVPAGLAGNPRLNYAVRSGRPSGAVLFCVHQTKTGPNPSPRACVRACVRVQA